MITNRMVEAAFDAYERVTGTTIPSWQGLRAALEAAEAAAWEPIETAPADGRQIWLSDGKRDVWLGVAHEDGSLKLPSRTLCKFWCTAHVPSPPKGHSPWLSGSGRPPPCLASL